MGIQPILAADSSTEAIAILSAAQLEDVTAIELDLFHRLPVNKIEAWNPNPYLLFLDPPRGGFPMIGEFCKSFSSLGEILYISCDLHAFARDAKNLSAQGWQLKEVQPLDQFPHTPHIELLSWFTHPEVKNADCPSR